MAIGSEPRTFVDDLRPLSAAVGWGSIGLRGDLGFDNKTVTVRGQAYSHAISSHPPARIAFELPDEFAQFSCLVGLNDTARAAMTSANFTVLADGRVAGAAWRVWAGGHPQPLEADVHGARTIELRVSTDQPEWCHAVWLSPALTREPVVADCLDRTELRSRGIARAGRCIATVVTNGFSAMLDNMLGSIEASGNCDDSQVVVLAVDPDDTTVRVAGRHGAAIVNLHARRSVNQSIKSALYSIARFVPADHFICLDCDTLVLGALEPLFAGQDACATGSIFVCADQNRETYPTLQDALVKLYQGTPGDLQRFLGQEFGEGSYPMVTNDGTFAGDRIAMLSLDSCIRAMPGAVEWANAYWLRNQFIFNLALARMRNGVRMMDGFNLQLHAQDVQLRWHGGRVRAEWQEQPVSILHFNANGRAKYGEWRKYFETR